MSMNAEEKAATGLMRTAFQMDGVVWNDDGTFNKDAIMDALNYYQEVLDADLVAPEDKTASGMEAYMRICSGTASFLVGPTMFVSKTQNPDDSAVVGQVEPILLQVKTEQRKKQWLFQRHLVLLLHLRIKKLLKNLLNGIHLLICRKN